MPTATITINDYDPSGRDFICPTCKKVGLFEWFQFCPYCGSELDWKITNEDFKEIK